MWNVETDFDITFQVDRIKIAAIHRILPYVWFHWYSECSPMVSDSDSSERSLLWDKNFIFSVQIIILAIGTYVQYSKAPEMLPFSQSSEPL